MARLLGIEKYTEEELRNFTDYPETKEILSAIVEKKANETPADFDEWGLRKDGLYQPVISEKDGYPSFSGVVFHGKKGGPFKKFIKQHEGNIVYLDIEAKPNAKKFGFTNYGVCETDEGCTGRTDNTYIFQDENNKKYIFEKEGQFAGFFKVGPETPVEHSGNIGDNDTRTVLTIVSDESTLIPKSSTDENNEK